MKIMKKTEGIIIVIVGIVALVAIGLILMNGSYDLVGQATGKKRCSESDLGRDYIQGGVATSGHDIQIDYCLDKETEGYPPGYLYETYCSGRSIAYEYIDCEALYGLDWYCSEDKDSGLGGCIERTGLDIEEDIETSSTTISSTEQSRIVFPILK